MKANRKGYDPQKFRPMARQNIVFHDPYEIKIHKIVSALSYGQKTIIPVENTVDLCIYAIKKSAYYNCMNSLKIIVSKDQTEIVIYMEI